ncbi:MAG: YegS/Rv2252/BmrU family lipid kinase [Lachnospiraceae bacterium]|nr:YegS/Rv2252/BmrU family lipid kinase [Lachnospiraceae bacterium]
MGDIHVLIIYNPVAGKGVIKKSLGKIKKLFSDNGIKVMTFATKGKDDAYRAAAKYAVKFGEKSENDRYYVIAAGGDGTLDEVMKGVLDSGRDIPVGIIPVGSTNDFGYSLGISGEPVKDAGKILNAIEENRTFRCDVATLNGEYYTYTASFGLFSDVSYATPRKLKNMFGHLAYIMYGAINLPKTKKIHTKIEYDGKKLEKDLLLGMAVSAKSVGGFRKITGRDVCLDDGLFELMIVLWPKNPIELLKNIKQAVGLMRGDKKAERETKDIDNGNGIKIVKAREIKFCFKDRIPFSVDGEFGGNLEKGKIKVIRRKISYTI